MISPPSSKRSSTRSPTARSTGRICCATSGTIFPARSAAPRICARPRCSTASTSCSGRTSFPPRADGGDARLCPSCAKGQLSLKLGKFGAFIGCSNYPECRYTRVLSPTGQDGAGGEGERPGVRVLGVDPATGDEITLRNGRFGDYVQQGEGEKPKRSLAAQGPLARRPDAGKSDRAAVAAARGRQAPDQRRADPRRHRPLRRPMSSTARPTPTSAATTTCWKSAAIARST